MQWAWNKVWKEIPVRGGSFLHYYVDLRTWLCNSCNDLLQGKANAVSRVLMIPKWWACLHYLSSVTMDLDRLPHFKWTVIKYTCMEIMIEKHGSDPSSKNWTLQTLCQSLMVSPWWKLTICFMVAGLQRYRCASDDEAFGSWHDATNSAAMQQMQSDWICTPTKWHLHLLWWQGETYNLWFIQNLWQNSCFEHMTRVDVFPLHPFCCMI